MKNLLNFHNSAVLQKKILSNITHGLSEFWTLALPLTKQQQERRRSRNAAAVRRQEGAISGSPMRNIREPAARTDHTILRALASRCATFLWKSRNKQSWTSIKKFTFCFGLDGEDWGMGGRNQTHLASMEESQRRWSLCTAESRVNCLISSGDNYQIKLA